MATNDIISKLRKKLSNGDYETYYLGPELQYIGAIPYSGNNNLEEELLMGENQIITTWMDGNIERITIEFRTEDIMNEYYILECYNYSNPILSYVENKILYLLNKPKEVITSNRNSGDSNDYWVENTNLYIADNIFSYQNINNLQASEYNDKFNYLPNPDNNLEINITGGGGGSSLLEKFELKYKNKNNQIINVSTRETTLQIINNKTVKKQFIINYINN